MATHGDVMQAGDRVLLGMEGKDVFMSKKLDPAETTATHAGGLRHSDIIGKRSRDTVRSTKGHDVRVYLPTLAEYITMTPRKVTPVYPANANLIVSLLDIHVDTYRSKSDTPLLEILEAGTGHGSITLHLARAVHGANPTAKDDACPQTSEGASAEGLQCQRQAVIHTIDLSRSHSEHAQEIIFGFRQGMYSNDIDFHVCDVSRWIKEQFAKRGLEEKENEEKAFLSHVVLDMPSAQHHIGTAASALHVNGGLLVFKPSISQIMILVQQVKEEYLPLQLVKVFEVGQNMTGGKEWDVRCVKPRARISAEVTAKSAPTPDHGAQPDPEALSDRSNRLPVTDPEEEELPSAKQDEAWKMVCRPRVGYMVTAGGFVAFFKKMKR